jgi:uncharacterized protein YbbC (DUF1343 family)
MMSPSDFKKPYALLTNRSVYLSSGLPIALELKQQGLPPVKIFSPEHGYSAQAADGRLMHDTLDPLTEIPVISLYGEKFEPSPADLHNIDFVLADLPNIGCRFYTYLWTLTHVMEACAKAGKPLLLIDRPNLSQRTKEAEEGPLLDETHYSSFLGRWTMPLTFSERYKDILQDFIIQKNIPVNLETLSPQGFLESDPAFIPPSPAIPTKETILIYPFTALFEGVNVNCGRGTSFPFFVLGAPWIDNYSFFKSFQSAALPGITSRPYTYTPQWSIYSGEICHGLFFTITDPESFRPVATARKTMEILGELHPGIFSRYPYPTAANPDGEQHLEKLLGVSAASFCPYFR